MQTKKLIFVKYNIFEAILLQWLIQDHENDITFLYKICLNHSLRPRLKNEARSKLRVREM